MSGSLVWLMKVRLSTIFLISCFDYALQCDICWSISTFIMEPVVQKREYLVKYKGLAHVHNLWITEEQLRLEAPAALARFKKYHKVP